MTTFYTHTHTPEITVYICMYIYLYYRNNKKEIQNDEIYNHLAAIRVDIGKTYQSL